MLKQQSQRVAELLMARGVRIVFAESCTAGLLANSLSEVPGVSAVLCGSFVTYRNASKSGWLGVSVSWLDDPAIGPVSEVVALEMARGALDRTPEAELAVSITGHLGPDAPEGLDGVAYSAIASRHSEQINVVRLQLTAEPAPGLSLRSTRQQDATRQVLQSVERWLLAHY